MELAKHDTDCSQEPTPRAQQEESTACKPEAKEEDALLAGRAKIRHQLAAAAISSKGATLTVGKTAETSLILQVLHKSRCSVFDLCFGLNL